ncbi:MAG: HAD-IA family hydrolase [Gemmatimonadetes bacterium]|nr:HAD-IA family hydrolase [Gemmatimonadota bacterium]
MKLILFDAGNTLVWVDHPFLIELLREHGLEFTGDELLEAEYVAKLMLDELVRSGRAGNDESRGRRYFSKVFQELGVPEALFPLLAERLEARHAERNLWTLVRPGTVEALEELQARGYRLGVISNADGRVAALLESVGLARYFDFILDSAVVGVEKPDPRIFRMGCEQGGARPEEAVYVGDIYEIDVVGARAVGMRTFLIDPLGRREELDCERIAGVHELPARLENAA